MDATAWLLVGLLPGLLVVSAFFSGSETALFSLSRHDRVVFAQSDRFVERIVATLLNESRSLLVTLLLGNMTINVLYFVVGTVLAMRATQPGWVLAATVLPLLGIILLGEVLPKLIAARLPAGWARLASGPLWIAHRGMTPIRVLAQGFVITPLSRLIAPAKRSQELEPEELEVLLALSEEQGVIDADEETLLSQVLELSQLRVRELMTPRIDMAAFDVNDGPIALAQALRATRTKRMVVFDDDVDHVLGVVETQDMLLNLPRDTQALHDRIKPVMFVPEQQRGDRLLVELKKQGVAMAVVVDEFGGTAGVVTMRDVVSHLFGVWSDDTLPGEDQPKVQSLGGGRYAVDAGLPVHAWVDFFQRGLGVDEAAKVRMVSTIGGLVMAELGRPPRVGDPVRLGNVLIEVTRVEGHRLREVIMSLGREVADG